MENGNRLVIEIPASENITKDECREMMNVVSLYDTLKKNPGQKVNVKKNQGLTLAILCGVLLALCVVLYFLKVSTVIISIFGVIAAVGLFAAIIMIIRVEKTVKMMTSDPVDQTFTLDEEGVELNSEEGTSVKMPWTKTLFVKKFENIVAFIPEDRSGFVICISKKYAPQIEKFLTENKPEIKVWPNGSAD